MNLQQNLAPFIYLHDFQVLICSICKFAVSKCRIQRHLMDSHRILPLQQRQSISQHSCNLVIRDPSNVITFQAPIIPIPELRPPISGFACRMEDCQYKCMDIDTMQKHSKRKHQWEPHFKSFPYVPMLLQTFYQGNYKSYFQVLDSATLYTGTGEIYNGSFTYFPLE